MKTTLIMTISILFILVACSGSRATSTPENLDWVNKLITQFQAAPVGNPPQTIWKYNYQGSTVYYIPPQCCDQMGKLYDVGGTWICAPDGGLTGRGDGKCPDFFRLSSNQVLIWVDPRSR